MNPKIPTGESEVFVRDIEVLGAASELPSSGRAGSESAIRGGRGIRNSGSLTHCYFSGPPKFTFTIGLSQGTFGDPR